MKKIEAFLERSADGTYSVRMDNEMFSGMGDTAEQAKQDMIDSMNFYKETCKQDGYKYPAWMNEEYEIIYKFDTQELLNFYKGIISFSALERVTGINKSNSVIMQQVFQNREPKEGGV